MSALDGYGSAAAENTASGVRALPLVSNTGVWPTAQPFDLKVQTSGDDEYCYLFAADSPEVVIVSKTPDADGNRLVIPLRFSSLHKARTVGRLLALALEYAAAIAAEPDRVCAEHTLITQRFSRRLSPRAICIYCGFDAGEVVEKR